MLHIPSAIVYFILSSVMVFGNKYLLSAWNFNYPIFLILIQIAVTVLFLASLNRFRTLFSTKEFFKNIKNLKYQCLTALFYSLHSITALKALVGLNIPMYATFKRCTPLVNLMLSFVMFNQKKDSQSQQSTCFSKINLTIFAMTFGVILAGIGDLKFDLNSYLYCGFSVIFQALYLSFIQKCSEKEKKESIETLYFSNLFAMPFLLFSFLATSEFTQVVDHFESYSLTDNFSFMLVLCLVIVCGCLLCFSQIWCTTNNNAITTSVIGVLKSFLQTLLGMFFYDAYKNMTALAFLGISINLVFGTWYTYLKYIEKENKNYSHLHSSQSNLANSNQV